MRIILAFFVFLWATAANAVCSSVPYTFVPGTTILSGQVNANFSSVVNCVNAIPTPTSLQGFRNRFINGNMIIDTRNGGSLQSSLSSGNTYTVDRLVYNSTIGAAFEAQRNLSAVTPPAGFSYYEGFQSLAATTINAGDYLYVSQRIEGYNVQDLNFGTANAQYVSLSFQVYASITGTYAGVILNGAGNRAYVFTYSVPVANTWTRETISVPGDTAGTWTTDNSDGMQVLWSLGCGSTYQSVLVGWNTASPVCTPSSVSVAAVNGATFYITGIQLEPGSAATAFETRLEGVEILLAQRYYNSLTDIFMNGYNTSTNNISTYVVLPTKMRAIPSVNCANVAVLNTNATPTVDNISQNGFRDAHAIVSTGTGNFQDNCTMSAEL